QYNLSYFTHISKNEQLIQEFEKYIDWHLSELFSSAEMVGKVISVTDSDVRSVLNSKGSYRKTLVSIINTISMKQYNLHTGEEMTYKKIHEQNIFLTIFRQVNTFQALMNRLREYLDLLTTEQYQWNIVWYTHYRPMSWGYL